MDCDGTKEANGIKGNRIPVISKVRKMFVRRCPRALVENNVDALDYWNEYRTWKCLKCLPLDGGSDSQDAKMIEALMFIENLVNSFQADDDYVKWRTNKTREKMDKENEAEEKKFTSFRDVAKNRK